MDAHLRDVRYFVAVAEELNFSRAAERLHVSQPALSKQIRNLETALRAPLFRREARSVRLTSAGEALLAAARAVVETWDEGVVSALDAAAHDARQLRVGTLTSVGRALYGCRRPFRDPPTRLAHRAPLLRMGRLHRRSS
jgi:DNA-binding transcriptional LysR family regulator